MLYYIYYNIYYNIYNIKLVAPCFPKTIFPNVARSACSVKRDNGCVAVLTLEDIPGDVF